MGDDGFLRQARCKIRRHNPEGDSLFISGRVTGKRVEDARHLVEVEQHANGASAIALGSGATAVKGFDMAIGANANGGNAFAAGVGAQATAVGATAVGYSATASGINSTAFGAGALTGGYAGSTAIGAGATRTRRGPIGARRGGIDDLRSRHRVGGESGGAERPDLLRRRKLAGSDDAERAALSAHAPWETQSSDPAECSGGHQRRRNRGSMRFGPAGRTRQ